MRVYFYLIIFSASSCGHYLRQDTNSNVRNSSSLPACPMNEGIPTVGQDIKIYKNSFFKVSKLEHWMHPVPDDNIKHDNKYIITCMRGSEPNQYITFTRFNNNDEIIVLSQQVKYTHGQW